MHASYLNVLNLKEGFVSCTLPITDVFHLGFIANDVSLRKGSAKCTATRLRTVSWAKDEGMKGTFPQQCGAGSDQ